MGGKGGSGQCHGHCHTGKGQFLYLINSLHLPQMCLSPVLQPGMAAPGNKPAPRMDRAGLGPLLLVLCVLTHPSVHTHPSVCTHPVHAPPALCTLPCSVCALQLSPDTHFLLLVAPFGVYFQGSCSPFPGPSHSRSFTRWSPPRAGLCPGQGHQMLSRC